MAREWSLLSITQGPAIIGRSSPPKETLEWGKQYKFALFEDPDDDSDDGKELMNMVWYCREPIEKNGEFVVCHECKSCKHVDDALSEKE